MRIPIDLATRRRTVLQARFDRTHRLFALVESNWRSNAESVIELQAFAAIMGKESEQGRDALAFADRMGRDASVAALRATVGEEMRTLQAELDQLTEFAY